ncbi:MAG: molybdopterin-dependent oxidoreductase [Planctomycetales bacterium]
MLSYSPTPADALHERTSRRDFLRTAIASGALLGTTPLVVPADRADDQGALPAGKRLILRSATPLNAEPALEQLATEWITPLESFYVRTHGPIPRLDGGEFRLSIEGMVERPLELPVAELSERFPSQDITATLTCAGNRRNEFRGPKISGVPWGAGAIGNARWTGVNLSHLLRHAGVRPEARHVWFEGADQITDKNEQYPFGGSVSLETALTEKQHPGVLLATRMNDRPLTPEHGFPLRSVVPGMIGARSVKWLRRIVVSDRPSPNHYQALAYKLITEETPAALAAAEPLSHFVVNSVICVPTAGAAVGDGRLTVRGFALPSGGSPMGLRRIELSPDEGATWTEATIVSPQRESCWVLWSVQLTVPANTQRLLVRATDATGQTQPRDMPWNAKGYQYNAWHHLPLKSS